ncbi:MAG: hypothetical protein AB3N10_10215 [Allomuricauda sp.]
MIPFLFSIFVGFLKVAVDTESIEMTAYLGRGAIGLVFGSDRDEYESISGFDRVLETNLFYSVIEDTENFQIVYSNIENKWFYWTSFEHILLPRGKWWEGYITIPILPFSLVYFLLFLNLKKWHNKSLEVTPLADARVAPQL